MTESFRAMEETFEELKELSEEELKASYDAVIKQKKESKGTALSVYAPALNFYLTEIQRRQNDKQMAKNIEIAEDVSKFTLYILILTVVNVVAAVANVVAAICVLRG